ncbi:unnamed protein product [Cyclocybe aegerita]|uniref:F-box domain-containing protein n=1 Tax=Cyclocybe aegerita TaxID=1973307 RepID=A0A8S0WFJ0_CYCAE|nr:unnamed protein product [Cyclocybe aegerita]
MNMGGWEDGKNRGSYQKPSVQAAAPKPTAATVKQVSGGKRKAGESGVEGQSKRNKKQGNNGHERLDLTSMPLDILFEIFARVNLADLLTLARTSNELRKTLMGRSSVTVWTRVRATMPGLPECPDDLSEPQYAELLTGNQCNGCGKVETQVRVIWAIRVKYCYECLHKSFKHTLVGEYSQELKDLVPIVMLTPKKNPPCHPLQGRQSGAANDELGKKFDLTFKTIKERNTWEKAIVMEQRARNAHGDACAMWAAYNKFRTHQALTMADRQALIIKYVRHIGWAEEYARIPSILAQPQYTETCLIACQTATFNAKTLLNLKTHLKEVMKYHKAMRIAKEKAEVYKQRLAFLMTAYASFVNALPYKAVYPSTLEIYQFSSVKRLIKDTPTTSEFTKDTVLCALNFNEILNNWKNKVRNQLVDLIRRSRRDQFEEATVLDLATTFYQCTNCSHDDDMRYGLHYIDAMTHKCAKSTKHNSTVDNLDAEAIALKCRLNEQVWNANHVIVFDERARIIMTEVVKACGLDPMTTTAKEMQALDPIIECLECNHKSKGRAVMRWSFVPAHHHTSLKRGKYKSLEGKVPRFVVVKGKDADRARSRMNEQYERTKAQLAGSRETMSRL